MLGCNGMGLHALNVAGHDGGEIEMVIAVYLVSSSTTLY